MTEDIERLAYRVADCVEPFGHPLRLRICALAAGVELLSPRVVAERFGIERPTAGYHVRKLANEGLLEADGEQLVNGGRERCYHLAAAGGQLLDALARAIT